MLCLACEEPILVPDYLKLRHMPNISAYDLGRPRECGYLFSLKESGGSPQRLDIVISLGAIVPQSIYVYRESHISSNYVLLDLSV